MDREPLYLAVLAIAATVTSIIVMAGIINYVGLDGDSGSRMALNDITLLAHNVDKQNITADHEDICRSRYTSNKSLKDISGVYPILY